MPRRKQDRPKRMKWEESSNERVKDDDGNGDDVLSLGPSSKDRTSDEDDSTANPDEDEDEGTEKRDDGGTRKKRKDLSSITFPNMQEVEDDEDDEDQVDDKALDKVDIDDSEDGHLEMAGIPKEPSESEARLGATSPSCSPKHQVTSPQSSPSTTPVMRATSPASVAPRKEGDCDDEGGDMHTRERRPEEYRDPDDDDIEQDCPLDFSVKKSPTKDGDCNRLIKESVRLVAADDVDEEDDTPLDLSVSRKRPLMRAELQPYGMGAAQAHSHHRSKSLRLESGAISKTSGPWSTQFPFRFSPSASPNSGVEIPLWNGGMKSCHSTPASSPSPSSSSSSVAAATSHPSNDISHHQQSHHHPQSSASSASPSVHRSSASSASPCGRHNAWQSHWLSRGAEQAKDVLKCVWCRKSFRSLEEMTNHMKEARHCGMHLHQSPIPPPMPPQGAPHRSLLSMNSGQMNNTNTASGASPGGAGAAKGTVNNMAEEQPSNMMMKESIPMPRKLVRGQDVWLGKGAEQTKQILKCMWCGQSFKTLAEMTTHMQQTQHYTNIISQEQIISWKSPEDRCSNQAHVNAVLTCKVCDQAFSSLKELSNHMVKNSHYKEHILRSITENGGRRRQTREKRKKSLPVRKLLELERAQNEMSKGHGEPRESKRGAAVEGSNGRITCEKCGKKIDTQAFVEHIRLCVGGHSGAEGARRSLEEVSKTASPPSGISGAISAGMTSSDRKSGRESGSPLKREHSTPSPSLLASHHPIPPPTHPNGQLEAPEAPSVLNAIERLIEKSFESKRNRQVYVGTGSNSGTPVNANVTSCSTPTPVSHSPISLKRSDSERERRASPAQHSKSGRRTPSSKEERERKRDGERHRRKREKLAGDKKAEKIRESDEERIPRAENDNEEDGDDEDDGDGDEDKSRKEDCLSSPSSNCSGIKEGSTKGIHVDPVIAMRLSPSAITNLKREASPARSLHSPASTCSNNSSVARGSHEGGGTLSLVCSSPSPTSPSCGDHPLRELQKLLDKTNVSLSKGTTSSTATTGTMSPSSTSASGMLLSSATGTVTTTSVAASNPGAILAFSWACNDAVVSDSIMKCAFCDTPFISKGAYRHHLSKMHFIKDGALPELSSPTASNNVATSAAAISANTITTSSSCSSNSNKNSLTTVSSKCPSAETASSPLNSSSSCKSPIKSVSSVPQDESPHSKFLKYTELAKQLSSKYV